MNNIIEFLISDIITASLISSVFLLISNKKATDLDREDEKRLQEIKQHIEQKIDEAVLTIENELLVQVDRIKDHVKVL